jgi:hypothetical protein
MDEVKKEKNDLLLHLMTNKDNLDEKTQVELNLKIANLEGRIARDYFNRRDMENACVNLVSQASCLVKAKYYPDALEVLNDIVILTCEAKLKEWARQEIAKIEGLTQKEEPDGIS